MGIAVDSLRGGTTYMPHLARYPNDPEAYVGSKTDIRKVLDRRGWGGEGMIDRDVDRQHPGEYRVAEDIVERHAMQYFRDRGIDKPDADEWSEVKDRLRAKLSGNNETVDRLD